MRSISYFEKMPRPLMAVRAGLYLIAFTVAIIFINSNKGYAESNHLDIHTDYSKECSGNVSAAVKSFYDQRWVRPFDRRSKVEGRLKELTAILIEIEGENLPCRHQSGLTLVGISGYLPGHVYLRLDEDVICANEDDAYYDLESGDMDNYPWTERWPGAITDAPARAIKFIPLCFTWSGVFWGYEK